MKRIIRLLPDFILFTWLFIVCIFVPKYFRSIVLCTAFVMQVRHIKRYDALIAAMLVYDIYVGNFPGISLPTIIPLFIATHKFKFIITSRTIGLLYYFLGILCACEFSDFIITSVLGCSYNLIAHLQELLVSFVLFSAYCFFQKCRILFLGEADV